MYGACCSRSKDRSVGPRSIATVLDELFRHFHSVKGISGMVDVRPAEELAHRLEDYLRVLRTATRCSLPTASTPCSRARRCWSRLSASVVPAASTRRSHRWRAGSRGWWTLSRRCSQAERRASRQKASRRRPPDRWRCTFIPSADLAARGIRVDSVASAPDQGAARFSTRRRASHAEGSIAFDFVLAAALDRDDRRGVARRRDRRRAAGRAGRAVRRAVAAAR